MPFHWNQLMWSWLKPMPTGEEESGGLLEEELYEVGCQVAEGVPSYLMRNQWTRCSWVLHQNWLFVIVPTEWTPLYMGVQAKWARCTTTTLEEQTLEESETEEGPKSVNCPLSAQCQTGEIPLGLVNRKLHAFIQTFFRSSLLDQGWKVWCRCRGTRGLWTSRSAFWRWRYWSHQWGLKDMTNHDFFNPTSLPSRDCKLTAWECGMGALAPPWIHMLLAFPMQGSPCHFLPYQMGRKTLLYKLTWNLSKNLWEGTGFSHPS